MNEFVGDRLAAVQKLQDAEKAATKREQFTRARILDRAIGLALSPRRDASSEHHLRRNAFRNARHMEYRSWKRVAPLSEVPDGDGRQTSRPNVRGPQPGTAGGVVDLKTPEDAAIGWDLLVWLESKAKQAFGDTGVRCLHGLIAGEPVEDTACACNVSPRTVERCRSQLRKFAHAYLQAAA